MLTRCTFRVGGQLSRLSELFKSASATKIVRSLSPTNQATLSRSLSCTPSFYNGLGTRTSSSTTSPLVGIVVEDDATASEVTKQVLQQVNAQVSDGSHGRLFAVVYIHGKQFKVTAEDLIVIQANMPVDIGDSLRLEKVLLVGGRDLTLVGRPLLGRDLVSVDATVVEKTLSQQVRNFVFKRRSRFQRHYFYRFPFTVLRINAIRLLKPC